MKIIDRYILQKFITTFFFMVGIKVAIIVVIDYTEHSDEFIKHNLGFKEIVVDYFLNFIPVMANMLSPISVFFAAMFVTVRMASHTEIVAIQSGGVSFRRLLFPFVLGAVLIAGLVFYLVGWIMPKAAVKKVAFENTYFNRSSLNFTDRNVHIKTGPDTYIYMYTYSTQKQQGTEFTIEQFKGNKLAWKMHAPVFKWDSVKSNWIFPNYTIRSFDGYQERIKTGNNLDTTLSILPKDFSSKHNLHETLTLPQLDAYIDDQNARGLGNTGIFEHEIHMRYSYPFAIIVLTLIAVIVSAKKTRKGSNHVQIILGVVCALFYVLMVILSRSLGEKGGMEPMIAAWFPTIVFSIITFIMYHTVPR